MFKKYKDKIRQLEENNVTLSRNLENSHKEYMHLANQIKENQRVTELAAKYNSLEELISNKQAQYDAIINEIEQNSKLNDSLKEQINSCSEQIEFNNLSLYEPKFTYKDSEEYKIALKDNITKQKTLIKSNSAICMPQRDKVALNDNRNDGHKFVKYYSELMLTAFNAACDNIVSKVTIWNCDKLENQIKNRFDVINQKGALLDIYITQEFLALKIEQLYLEGDKVFKKEQERQEREHQKEILREQEAVLAEIEKAQSKLEKEKIHYEQQIKSCDVSKIAEFNAKIAEIDSKIAENDYRAANNRAGFVYVLANPSLGENVYKIGVTRALDPNDRVDALSNASVPFKFKPNCFIFSEDAFALETALHNEFAEYRVNKANRHKEYFELPIDKIAEVIYNKYDKNVKIDYAPINEEWLLSEQMKGN